MKGQMGRTAGSTPASDIPRRRRQRVPWQEAHEPGASSEERGPTPALPPAQRPPRTGEDTASFIINNFTAELD